MGVVVLYYRNHKNHGALRIELVKEVSARCELFCMYQGAEYIN